MGTTAQEKTREKTLSFRPTDPSLRLLVFAPFGRDAALVCKIVSEEGIACHGCPGAAELESEIGRGAGAAILAEEAITPEVIKALRHALANQPRWSDFPLIVLTGGVTTADSRRMAEQRAGLDNVALLERPVRILTLLSTVRTALRARQRQYEIRDHIVQRQLAAEELVQSQERLQMAVESAALGTWDFNTSAGEFHWSDRCSSLFGFAKNTAVTRHAFLAGIHPDDRKRVDDTIRSAFASEGSGRFATEFRTLTSEDGTQRWLLARGKALFDDAGKPVRFTGTFVDITQAKLAEETLRRTEKLVTAGRMAATIAHEINNPLAAATNLVYLAKIELDANADARKYLDQADQELARVAHITQQTLGFYRESSAPTGVDVRRLIEGVLQIYHKKFETRQLKIDQEYRSRVSIQGIEGEIRQVLSNVITNAADAVPVGGKLRVRTSNAVMRNGEPALRILVADNGRGISPEHRGHIFEPFYTTKAKIGTGLGLWVVREIIEKHGGRVSFRSRTSEGISGTVFSILLPRHPNGGRVSTGISPMLASEKSGGSDQGRSLDSGPGEYDRAA